MFPVKENFKNKINKQGQNFNCEICKKEKDKSKTFTPVSVLKDIVPELNNTKVKYKNIFGNTNQMVKAGKLFKKVIKARNKI